MNSVFLLSSLLFYILILSVSESLVAKGEERRWDAAWQNVWYNSSGFINNGVLQDRWIPMTQREALNYYTPFELCLLAGGSNECATQGHEIGALGRCTAGFQSVAHSDKECTSHAGYLLRYHTTRPWPHSANLLDLIQHMRKRGSNTVILIGDSVMGQMLADAYCSLLRAGVSHMSQPGEWQVDRFHEGFGILRDEENVTMALAKTPFFQMLFHEFHPHDLQETTRHLEDVKELLWPGNFRSSVTGDIVYIINLGLHIAFDVPDDVDGIYENCITKVLEMFNEQASSNDTIIFRETTAQHFKSPSGMYDRAKDAPYEPLQENKTTRVAFVSQAARESGLLAALNESDLAALNSSTPAFSLASTTMTNDSPPPPPPPPPLNANEQILFPDNVTSIFGYQCQAITNETMMHIQNWRNMVLRKVCSKLDPYKRRFLIAPFYKITASRHDLHHFTVGDCTHYCSTPMLWAPLWESIAHLYHHGYVMKNEA